MTSKRSLWVNIIENHKRRIVVWILSALGNIMIYPVLLLMYYTRIRSRYERGEYQTVEFFKQQMKQTTCDALCFRNWTVAMACGLAVLIAVHGFSYLYSRRKQDLYLSVPVSMKERFRIIYINGIVIYLATSIPSLLAASLLAAFEGVVDGNLFGRICVSYLFTFCLFLCFYNLALVALMLTGNVVITGAGGIVLFLYGYIFANAIWDYKKNFLERYTVFFHGNSYSFLMSDLYFNATHKIYYVQSSGKAFLILLPYMGGMLLYAAAALALSYFLYKKRPSEAAGKSIAFRAVKPVLKVAMIIPVALLAGTIVYDLTEQNVPSVAFAIIAGGILFGMAVEVVFEMDLRAALHHLPLTLAGTCAAFLVFGVVKWDVFGYDSYVPKPEEIESYAVYDAGNGGRNDHWIMLSAEDMIAKGGGVYGTGVPSVTPGQPYYAEYIDTSQYVKEHMFLTDTEAICSLANKTLHAKREELTELREVNVLYRLKNGREVARAVWFDIGDDLSEPFLNRIYGTPEYVDGVYQEAHLDEVAADQIRNCVYTNGIQTVKLGTDTTDAKALTDAWITDMKRADLTYFKNHLPIGQVDITFWSYRGFSMPVYEDFTETLACLKQQDALFSTEISADDISGVIVTNYNNDSYDKAVYYGWSTAEAHSSGTSQIVRKEYKDKQQINEILDSAYSSDFDVPFMVGDYFDNNYNIEVYLNTDDEASVEVGFLRHYRFFYGKVPDFVKQDTTAE